MEAVLAVFSRWVHVVSAIFLLGGVLYARIVLAGAAAALDEAPRAALDREAAARFRNWLLAAMAALLLSGLYNLLTKEALPKGYHMVFGIKMLLALHVFAVGLLLAKRDVPEEKRRRWMSGVVVSGLLIALLSAVLRRLTQ